MEELSSFSEPFTSMEINLFFSSSFPVAITEQYLTSDFHCQFPSFYYLETIWLLDPYFALQSVIFLAHVSVLPPDLSVHHPANWPGCRNDRFWHIHVQPLSLLSPSCCFSVGCDLSPGTVPPSLLSN